MAHGDWIDGEQPGDGRIRRRDTGLYEFQVERFIPRPIERAWAAITIPERLAEWLGPIADLDLRVGGRFVVMFDRQSDDGVHAIIREYDPPQRLAFDWIEGGCADLRCSFELTPEVDGCRLVFSVWGLRETEPGSQVRFVPGSSAGWRLFMDELVQSVTGELPEGGDQPFEDAEARYKAHFGPSTPGWDKPWALRGHEADPFITAAGDGFSNMRFSRVFGPPVEKMWAALTEPARIAHWYGSAEIDFRKHGDVMFRVGDRSERGFIVALEPGKVLAWALPLENGRHTVAHVEMASWAKSTRCVLTLRDVPNTEIATAATDWMRRLHDLADASQA